MLDSIRYHQLLSDLCRLRIRQLNDDDVSVSEIGSVVEELERLKENRKFNLSMVR